MFGKQQGSHLYTGLVDSESEMEFDEKLQNLKNVWNDRECQLLCSFKPSFFNWFLKYQSEIFKKKMLKPVRVSAGLGDPPMTYTNNANESANAQLKEKVDYKKSELKVFCGKMRDFVDTQYQNVEKAFTGPYAVSEQYTEYRENPIKWVKQKEGYKKRAINKIHNIPPIAVNSDKVSNIINTGEADHTPLSVSFEEAEMPCEVFKEMWEKAEKLVDDNDAITDAPKLSNCKVVTSYSNPFKPHIVSYATNNGKFSCDCYNGKSKQMCSHTLATAERVGLLPKFIAWYKTEVKGLSLWNLVRSSGVSKHPGEKPRVRKRTRKVKPKVMTTSSLSNIPTTVTITSSPNSKRQSTSNEQENNANLLMNTSCEGSVPFNVPQNPQTGWFNPLSPYGYSPYVPPVMPPLHVYQPPYASPTGHATTQTVYESPTSSHLFVLKFITLRISKCQGCKQQFRQVSQPGLYPPNDLIVSRLEQRTFVAYDGSVKVGTTPNNSHYHLKMQCLLNADPFFRIDSLVIPEDVEKRLLPVHKSHLQYLGVIVH